MSKSSAGLGRIAGGLVVLAAVWFGLGKLRDKDADVTPPTPSATSSSAPKPPPAPRDHFQQPIDFPADTSRLVLPGDFQTMSAAKDGIFTVAKGSLAAHALDGTGAKVLTQVSDSTSDLTPIGDALVWTESDDSHESYRRTIIEAIDKDGARRRRIAGFGSMSGRFYPAGSDLVYLYGDHVTTLGADLVPHPVVDIRVPGGVVESDPEGEQKLLRMSIGMASAFGGNGERIYWSTVADTVQDSKVCSIARSGGRIDVLAAPPHGTSALLLGVAGDRIYTSVGGQITMKRGDAAPVPIEGDARGTLHLGAQVAGGDLYVLVDRLVGAGKFQSVVFRLRADTTKVEAVVETRAFAVVGDTLYFLAKDGVRAMPR
jgi:hypothetical protein